jgi:hypothetical protein
MYRNDVGLLQNGSGARLTLETLTETLVLRVLIGQDLQRDSASLAGVERLVHLTHTTLAEQSVDLVLAEILTDARRHVPVPPQIVPCAILAVSVGSAILGSRLPVSVPETTGIRHSHTSDATRRDTPSKQATPQSTCPKGQVPVGTHRQGGLMSYQSGPGRYGPQFRSRSDTPVRNLAIGRRPRGEVFRTYLTSSSGCSAPLPSSLASRPTRRCRRPACGPPTQKFFDNGGGLGVPPSYRGPGPR